MQIGIVAKKIGLSVDAIRFYERNALLPRAARTQGGFRQYGESDVETLAFIRCVQGLGFKLTEIRGLLSLRASRFSRVRRCAADCKKNWLMYSGNLRTFRSWNTSCAWPCGVATENYATNPLIAQSCQKRMHANRRVPSES
jgi:DNA-binding transcriptional MerR regulator